MDEPKLVVAKIELRFDTELGARDCLPGVHKFMRERLKVDPENYMISNYKQDDNDQKARVISVLLGIPPGDR